MSPVAFRWLAPLLGAAIGCSGDRPGTGVVVEVGSDLVVPGELDGVRIRIFDAAGTKRFDATSDLGIGPGRVSLPVRLGVVPEGDEAGSFTVEVVGQKGLDPRVSRRATLPFVRNRILLLRLWLVRQCVEVTCAADTTCFEDGICRTPVIQQPEKLPDYVRSVPDAGPPDAPAEVDGGVEATPDLRDGTLDLRDAAGEGTPEATAETSPDTGPDVGADTSCSGVTCDSPPLPACPDATKVRTYVGPGTCSDGGCVYSYSDTPCPYGCVSGACQPKPTPQECTDICRKLTMCGIPVSSCTDRCRDQCTPTDLKFLNDICYETVVCVQLACCVNQNGCI